MCNQNGLVEPARSQSITTVEFYDYRMVSENSAGDAPHLNIQSRNEGRRMVGGDNSDFEALPIVEPAQQSQRSQSVTSSEFNDFRLRRVSQNTDDATPCSDIHSQAETSGSESRRSPNVVEPPIRQPEFENRRPLVSIK